MSNQVIGFGEVLWDMLPDGARIGGAPLNVCYHLQKAGVEAKVISQVGKDDLGNNLLHEIKTLGLDDAFISQSENHPTSTVEVFLSDEGVAKYQIVEKVAWDYIPFKQEVAEQIAKADAFIFGSLVARNACSRETLLNYIKYSKYNIIDVNMRAPFYSKDSLFELLRYVHFLKINDEEIKILAEWLNVEHTEEKEIIDTLFNTFPSIQEILLTKGTEGSVYYTHTIREEVGIQPVIVKDTVGCGDSFLATFIAHKLKNSSIREALDAASLLSGFVAANSGATPYYDTLILQNFKMRALLKENQ